MKDRRIEIDVFLLFALYHRSSYQLKTSDLKNNGEAPCSFSAEIRE